MDLIKTIWNVCRHPSCFPALAQRSVWRALFYYLLLAFLLAFCFSLLESCSVNKEIRAGCKFVFDKTGGFVFSSKGVTTVRTPDEKKSYEIITSRGKLRMDYLPSAILTVEDMNKWQEDTLYGIILLRNGILTWTKYTNEDRRVLVMTTLLEKKIEKLPPALQVLDKEAFASFVKETGKDGSSPVILRDEFKDAVHTDPVILSRILEAFTSFGSWGILLIQYMVFGLFAAGFFILVQLFRLGPDGKRLALRTNCTITLFAALPGLLAGAVFQALHIPFFDFQNVFLIVFFIYDIMAFNAYYRSFRAQETISENEDKEE